MKFNSKKKNKKILINYLCNMKINLKIGFWKKKKKKKKKKRAGTEVPLPKSMNGGFCVPLPKKRKKKKLSKSPTF